MIEIFAARIVWNLFHDQLRALFCIIRAGLGTNPAMFHMACFAHFSAHSSQISLQIPRILLTNCDCRFAKPATTVHMAAQS
jgi:hypothetical protein